MNTKPDTVYYSNQDGVTARVSRDLMSGLFQNLSNRLNSEEMLMFIGRTRIPNERELYGAFIYALNKSISDPEQSDLGHIATEFQVGRSDDAKGRVDFFFEYRNVSFLLELKVTRVALDGEYSEADDDERNALARITMPWINGVVAQLKNLDTTTLSSCLQKKVVKIAMVIYLHVDWRKSGAQVGWKDKSKPTHELVMSDLREVEPEFSYFSTLNKPVRTRGRRTGLNEDHNMSMYGFTFVASTFVTQGATESM